MTSETKLLVLTERANVVIADAVPQDDNVAFVATEGMASNVQIICVFEFA